MHYDVILEERQVVYYEIKYQPWEFFLMIHVDIDGPPVFPLQTKTEHCVCLDGKLSPTLHKCLQQ